MLPAAVIWLAEAGVNAVLVVEELSESASMKTI